MNFKNYSKNKNEIALTVNNPHPPQALRTFVTSVLGGRRSCSSSSASFAHRLGGCSSGSSSLGTSPAGRIAEGRVAPSSVTVVQSRGPRVMEADKHECTYGRRELLNVLTSLIKGRQLTGGNCLKIKNGENCFQKLAKQRPTK